MKKARLILSASMIALMGLSAVTFSSCSKDDDCAVGYTGKNCDQEIRTPMLGTYNATDKNDADPTDVSTYTLTITEGATTPVVNIHGFGDFFTNTEIVTSNVSESGDNISFTIPSQLPDDVYTVSGSGTYNSKSQTITINYSLSDGSQIKNYTGTWTQQ
ncbi:MAG TPA: hypothetical protein VFL76_10385 [Edaphocola sp.]|nr:hypothetical protein [Edaphocola sp.]